MDEPVERRQQRRPSLEVVREGGGVDAPLALHALDHGGLAGLTDVDRLDPHRPSLLPGDAERGEPPLVLSALGLLDRRDWRRRPDRSARRDPSRSRATRPAIATSPRIIRNSSIWVTLRLFDHPVEAHGATRVRDVARAQRRSFRAARGCRAGIGRCRAARRAACRSWATRPRRRGTGRSPIGRTRAPSSNSVRSCSRARLSSSGSYAEPRRLQATRSALGAIAEVGSICNRVSRCTTVSNSVGRRASRSAHRDARACSLVSRCTDVRPSPVPRSSPSGRFPRLGAPDPHRG